MVIKTVKSMNSENKQIRSYWLTVRLNEEEHSQLDKLFAGSTCRRISDYVRKVILNKPVNIKYRNLSVDDFLKEFLQLKKELNAIGNNFNQSVHKLHTLDKIPEFRQWVLRNEQDKAIFLSKMDTILNRLHEIHQLWSRL